MSFGTYLEALNAEIDDIKPINPEALQLNKAYFYNLNITRATLRIYTESILKSVQKEIEETLEMLEKELSQE